MRWPHLPCGGTAPDCIISLDVLAPGDRDFAEIRVMTMEKFQAFVMSEKIVFQAEGKSQKKKRKKSRNFAMLFFAMPDTLQSRMDTGFFAFTDAKNQRDVRSPHAT